MNVLVDVDDTQELENDEMPEKLDEMVLVVVTLIIIGIYDDVDELEQSVLDEVDDEVEVIANIVDIEPMLVIDAQQFEWMVEIEVRVDIEWEVNDEDEVEVDTDIVMVELDETDETTDTNELEVNDEIEVTVI